MSTHINPVMYTPGVCGGGAGEGAGEGVGEGVGVGAGGRACSGGGCEWTTEAGGGTAAGALAGDGT